MERTRRLALTISVAALAVATSGLGAVAEAASPHVTRAAVKLTVLSRPAQAFATPDHRSARLGPVAALRPITGERTTLPVLGHREGRDGLSWLRVMLPGRPNSHAGWIAAASTTPTTTGWRIVVSLSARRVWAFRHGRLARTFGAVVGKPTTPTPQGNFFVEETVQLGGALVGGPFALALSARSNVLQEFDGGPGQIALHGRGNIGGDIGTAESHGCVRLEDASITWLATHIGPGVPVTIKK